jgi:hypothetical protein
MRLQLVPALREDEPEPPGGTLQSAPEVQARIKKAFHDAFTAATREGQLAREDLFGLSLSALGGCIKAAAYALAGTPPSDPELAYAYQGWPQALLGTWQHEGLLPWLAYALGGEYGGGFDGVSIEERVTLRVHPHTIAGSLDLWWETEGLVLDLKTVGEHKLNRVLVDGRAYHPHRLQVAGYALAKQRAGHTVRWIVWAYMDRANGDLELVIEPFTVELAAAVVARVGEIQWWAQRPDEAPREEHGPGLSLACDGCARLRRCWGEDAAPGHTGPQAAVLGATSEAVDFAMNEYKRLGQEETRIKAERKFWREVFSRWPSWTPAGKWQHYTGKSRAEDDKEAAVALLKRHGIPVPTKPRKGSLYVVSSTRKRPKE